MNKTNGVDFPITIVGDDRLAVSIAEGLRANGYFTVLLSTVGSTAGKDIQILTDWPETILSRLVVVATVDRLEDKLEMIQRIEERVSDDTIIAINMEAVSLPEIVEECRHPKRIFGLNWTFPVGQTYFAEIISHAHSNEVALESLVDQVKKYWNKDPYVVQSGFSIRARMMAAMLREALYLVEEDFASVESVDRACRNDAGYYLPFAGNFRYMDLMGTYAYGMVMKDLNPELSTSTTLSPILREMRTLGETGMDQGQGFYAYSSDDRKNWEEVFDKFSKEMKELIKKFDHEKIYR